MTLTETIDATTFQIVHQDDEKTFKAFLRKVCRGNLAGGNDGGWRGYASLGTEWKLQFTREIKGDVGEPDRLVTVQTDVPIRIDGKPGQTVKSFHDCDEVLMGTPRSIHVAYQDVCHLCNLLIDGARLSIECSSGSTNTSRLGLSFFSLEAHLSKVPYSGLQIGGTTVCHNGKQACCSIVDCYH